VHQHQKELDDEEDSEEELITEEMLGDVEHLSREEYDVQEILADSFLDLDQLAEFLDELQQFKPKHDDKLNALVKLMKTDPVLKQNKVLIFTEFAETARYLRRQLVEAELQGVEEIDSTKKDRSTIIRRFAPYYNGSSSMALAEAGEQEIRVLISTDVLSEGLNLQDATRLINYDLHWNPVRLMQRIGRVDRRMNPRVEEKLLGDHPEQRELRGKIAYWNFLPPSELEELLQLFNRVTSKTLRISKTFGIEGKKLLHPEDDFEALKDFNHGYEGTQSSIEKMRLEYQQLFKDAPDLAGELDALPGRAFSGKQHPQKNSKALFFCWRLPKPDHDEKNPHGELVWTEAAGETGWYLYNLADDSIVDDPSQIVSIIRSLPETPRRCELQQSTLMEIRAKIEKHIKNTYLKKVQAPMGVKPVLKAWMELN